MVDQVLALVNRGHRGPLTALSRHGLIPSHHSTAPIKPAPVDLPTGSARLSQLLAAIVQRARDEVAVGGDWRSVVDGLREDAQQIWHRLPGADRRRFHRHLAALWSIHRHRMAPAIGDRIAALRTSGRLSVRAGRLVAIGGNARGVLVGIRYRGEAAVAAAPFDWVVNCSGASWRAPDRLVATLFATGLARPDPAGRGIDVADDCSVIARDGDYMRGLIDARAAGPPAGTWRSPPCPRSALEVAAVAPSLAAGTARASARRSHLAVNSLPRAAWRGRG